MTRWTSWMVVFALIAPLSVSAQTANKGKRKQVKKQDSSSSSSSPSSSGGSHSGGMSGMHSGGGYGVAGCGLGSIVIGPKPGMIQIGAATLNGTGMQTFGITTGTSNCDIPEMGHQAAVFIEVNRETLAKDAARGQGDTVAGLAYILNCDDASALGQNLQQNFEKIFAPEKSSYDATRAILSTIENNQALKATCHLG